MLADDLIRIEFPVAPTVGCWYVNGEPVRSLSEAEIQYFVRDLFEEQHER